MEQTTTEVHIGIDVSMAWLDAHAHPVGRAKRFANDPSGLTALLAWLAAWPGCRVALEATGGLERAAVEALQAADIPVSRVNPERIWAWRRAQGQNTKTDQLDARAIARFAACLQPRAQAPMPAAMRLKDLFRRRETLVRLLAEEKKRARRMALDHPAIAASLQAIRIALTAQIKALGLAMRRQVAEDATLQAHYRLLVSAPGVGEVTALALLAEMPELGSPGPKQVASLAGLAPHTQESGAWKGRARLRGGRPQLRAKLFMAASTAARCNPPLKAYCDQLLQRGKHWKCAITATMRKLLIILNAILHNQKPWQPA